MIPLLLKPKLLSIKNKWCLPLGVKQQRGQDLVVGFFSLLIMLCIYNACYSTLTSLHVHNFMSLHPTLLLGVFFMMLFAMLIFSSCVAALGALFMSKDLELLLASPLAAFSFFWGKTLQIMTSSSWMSLVFGVPLLLAFGEFYQAPGLFYVYCLLILLPFFIIPAAWAVTAVTLITKILPVSRTREILFLGAVGVLVGLYILIQLLSAPQGSLDSLDELFKLLSLLSLPYQRWLPSHWAAVLIGEALQPSQARPELYLILLYSTAAASGALAYLTLRTFHFSAYSKSQHSSHSLTLQSRRSQQRLQRLTFFMGQPFRAILAKELKICARDITQTMQLILLIAICFIYLYNFKFLREAHPLPEELLIWWRGILALANVAMGSFIMTAISTRFVFPSVSLEGQAYWLLASAPLSLGEILRAKFWSWYIPVTGISAVIFVSGALAVDAAPEIVAASALISCIMSYGIVGLGIGLGALFADFDWENPSQLSASLGSLLYMLASLGLIALDLLVVGSLVFLGTVRLLGGTVTAHQWQAFLGGCFVFLSYLNYAAARWALKTGENGLLARRKN